MGCHTWFFRPLLPDDIGDAAKQRAIEDVTKAFGDTEENRKLDSVDLDLVNRVRGSVERDDDLWWIEGWGFPGIEYPELFEEKWYIGVPCPDIFRRKTYPRKIIHNRRQLLNYLGKEYYSAPSEHRKLLSEFWEKYPGGILHWG